MDGWQLQVGACEHQNKKPALADVLRRKHTRQLAFAGQAEFVDITLPCKGVCMIVPSEALVGVK